MNGSPFVGPRPFETEDRDRFFGRTRELEELLSLVIAHRAVLVYAQSGAGKTSLLKAGVIPRLAQHGYKILSPARVQGLLPANLPAEKVANIFAFHTLLYWATDLRDGADAEKYAQTTLAEFLEVLVPVCRPDEECAPPLVIVFDQFEEFFTANAAHWQERAPFFKQLAQALETIPTLKVVFVMREEYIAQLDPFAELLPEKLRTRMHLERLRGNSALNAVVKPFQSRGLSFDAGAAEKLMAELSEIRVSEGDKFRETRGEFVEPVQLQVVCQSLWENLNDDWKNGSPAEAQSPRLITPDFVGRYGDVNDALAHYYDRSVERAAAEGDIGEGELRRWIGTALITRTGTRGLAFRGVRGAPGTIPGLALKCLEDAHVIRREERGGATTHELTHDRFIEPIQQSNQAWLGRFTDAEKIRARLEEKAQNHETTNELLDEVCLREAEGFLAQPEAETLGVSKLARDLVKRSRHALEEEEKRRAAELAEARRRATEEERLHRIESERVKLLLERGKRERTFALTVFILGAIAVGAVGYNLNGRRQLSERARQLSEREAEQLKAEKQKLVAQGENFRERAKESRSDENDPIRDITELRNLSIALNRNPDDTEAATRAAELLLQKIWCPPLAQEARYRQDALLAAIFAPTTRETTIFVAAGDGQLLRWQPLAIPPLDAQGPTLTSVDPPLFKKPKPPVDSDQVVQPGFASFSPDGQWLLVIPATLSSAAYAVAPPGAGAQGPGQAEPKSARQACTLVIRRWSPVNGTYEPSGKDLEIQRLGSSRTAFAWSPESDRVVLVNWRRDETQCNFLQIGADGIEEQSGWSDQLTGKKIAAASFSSEGKRLATVSSERRVAFLSTEDLSVIPGALAGEDSYLLPEGFQPNSVIFGPGDDELTLMSWTGVRVLNVQNRQPPKPLPQPTFRDQSMRTVIGPGDSATRLIATSLYGRIKVEKSGSELEAEPVFFRGPIGIPQFSADGRQMLIVSGGMMNALDCMRLIDLSPMYRKKPEPVQFEGKSAPSWLAEIASAVSALDAGGDGSLTTLQMVRDRNRESKAGNPHEAVWQRFFPEEAATR